MSSTPRAGNSRIKLNPSFWRHTSCVPFAEDVVPSSLFLKNRHYLIFDVETKKLVQDVGGWENIEKLGISVACAYDSQTDEFIAYREEELGKLIELMQKRLVIGYNIKGFDIPVLKPYGLDARTLDVFDIMYDIEAISRTRFIKLETLAQGTLGVGKSADGLMAVEWYKAGQIQKIIDYCMQDVKVTRDLFQYGRQHGLVKIKRADGSTTDVPVRWN